MKVINLYGGPGAGKSVMAANLYAKFKATDYETELVGEFAKELIYLGNEVQLVNQVYIMGSQYRKLVDLKRAGIKVAVSDSPLLLQLVYCEGKPYYDEIKPLLIKLNKEFDNVDVFLNRYHPYQKYGRMQTEDEAKVLDERVRKSMEVTDHKFHYTVDGNDNGTKKIFREVLGQLDS